MGAMAARAALAAVFVFLADYLLFDHAPGCGVTVFALALAAALALWYRRRVGRCLRLGALWLVIALGASLQSSAIGMALIIALGWAALAAATYAGEGTLLASLAGGAIGGVRALVAPLAEYVRLRALSRDSGRRRLRLVSTVLLPAIIVAVFGTIMIPANLVLSDWVSRLAKSISDLLRNVTAARLFFWAVVGFEVYGLLRFRAMRVFRARSGSEVVETPQAAGGTELRMAVATLIGLNALFLAANAADAAYLWFSLELPKGLTYSEFAHSGSYRLIAAVVMSAAVITAFFRARAPQSRRRAALALAYLFAAQNVMVLFGAARRLELYVDVYGLTRFRLAAFIWMALVLTGFALIFIKLLKRLPFLFLLRTNAVSVALALSAVSLLDLNAFIAGWNVDRFERGAPVATDVNYLERLGPSAIPALARLAEADDESVSAKASVALQRTLDKAIEQDELWQSRTLRLQAAIRAGEFYLARRPSGVAVARHTGASQPPDFVGQKQGRSSRTRGNARR